MPVFSDILDLKEMKVGEVQDAYKRGELMKFKHDGYMLAHHLLTSGKPHEYETEHIPTLKVAKELIERSHKNPNQFPIFDLLK